MRTVVSSRLRIRAMTLCTAALLALALPISATAQTWTDPVIPPSEDGSDTGGSGSGGSDTGGSGSGGSGTGGNDGGSHDSDLINQDGLTDATGTTVTSSRDSKSLLFESDASREGTDLEYDPGIDSSEGGGTNGGFPYWEGNGDWMVTESARCEVTGYNEMTKVAGTKQQTFSCFVTWMNGGNRQYVDLANCEAGANNTKPAATKSYYPASCPHPEWVIGSWRSWYNTSGWYRRSSDRGKTCGTITEYRNQRRTRSLSCSGGTYSECRTYNGPVQTAQTRRISRSRDLGSCLPYFVIRYHFTVSESGYKRWHQQPSCIANCGNVRASGAYIWGTASSWSIGWVTSGGRRYLAYYNPGMFSLHKMHDYSSGSTIYRYMDIRIPNKYK